MPEAPQPNTAEARSPTGELVNQASTQPSDPSLQTVTSEKTTTEPAPSSTTEPKPTELAKAPDSYSFKAPEGYELNETVVAEASTLFKELGLSQASAQRLVDFNAKLAQSAADAPYAAYDAMREGWQSQVKADPELGPKLPQVKETIGRALDTLGDPKLIADMKEALNLTGAGDHPAFIKAFYKFAQAVVEGRPVTGANPSPHGQSVNGVNQRPSAAKGLYPNLP